MNNYQVPITSDDRFFGVPFLVGGIAGTALGYGIAQNNQSNSTYYPVYPSVPVYTTYMPPIMEQYPTYSTSNNYYYN